MPLPAPVMRATLFRRLIVSLMAAFLPDLLRDCLLNASCTKAFLDRSQESTELRRVSTVGGHQGAHDWIFQNLGNSGVRAVKGFVCSPSFQAVPVSHLLLTPIGMKIKSKNTS